METLIVDASVAIKWVVEEQGSAAAVALRSRARLAAPELLVPECANILWKKVQRGELTSDEAALAARLLERSGVRLIPMAGLLEPITRLALELSHPAYDCAYLAVAIREGARLVTADSRLLRLLAERGSPDLSGACVALSAMAGKD
jgi:predicted nucleic acid-binding protein